MMTWSRMAGVAVLVFAEPASAANSFTDLQATYRCEVVRRLEQIYATGDPRIDLNRYLAISLRATPNAYVQCIFHDNQSRVYCEASSGFWGPRGPRRLQLSTRAVAALAKLGFDTDGSAGNFKFDRDVDKSANFHPLADIMLRALHDGYGARSHTQLTFAAPFAPGTPASCLPVS
jgi:hypothetical protein